MTEEQSGEVTIEGTELVTTEDVNAAPVAQITDSADLDLFTGSGQMFMPRLQLCTDNSDAVKERKIESNHFAVVNGKRYTDLGESVDMYVAAYRSKALMIEPEGGVISCYDPQIITTPEGKKTTSGLFKEIADKSFERDSGCMYGLEFLVWLPATNGFVTFFFGSKTMREESKAALMFVGKRMTAKPHLITTKARPGKKSYTYSSAAVESCTNLFQLPEQSEILAEITRFQNPPKETREVATAEEAENMDRPQ